MVVKLISVQVKTDKPRFIVLIWKNNQDMLLSEKTQDAEQWGNVPFVNIYIYHIVISTFISHTYLYILM